MTTTAEVCVPAAKKALQGWARWGYMARGIIHAVTGGLGLATAIDARGAHPTDGPGVLVELFHRPFGAALIVLLALGLVGFGVWRVYESFTEQESKGVWRVALCAAGVLSFVTHLGLAYVAVQLLYDGHGTTAEQAAEETTASLLSMGEHGSWLVVAMGLSTIGMGVTCFVRGFCAPLTKDLKTEGAVDKGVWSLGVFGHLAQGVALLGTGGFFLLAAWRSRPQDAGSVKGVLEELQRQPLGPWLLALVSAGLFAFGLFAIAEAVFRRMPEEKEAAKREQPAGASA